MQSQQCQGFPYQQGFRERHSVRSITTERDSSVIQIFRHRPSGKGSPHQALTVTHSDLGSFEVYSADYGQAFEDSPGTSLGYNVNVVFAAQTVNDLGSKFTGYMVLDTACQRNCCGRNWISDHNNLLLGHGIEIIKADVRDKFQFGKGDPVTADYRACIPASLGSGKPLFIGAGVVDADVPLLASNVLLKALGMVLDLNSMTARFTALGTEAAVESLGGHLTVRIADFGEHSLQALAELSTATDWSSAHPEALVGPLRAPAPTSEHVHHSSGVASVLATTRPGPTALSDQPLPHHDIMIQAVRLGIWNRQWLIEATPPRLDANFMVTQETCQHAETYRYGNSTGRFAKCRLCGKRWVWLQSQSLWQHHPYNESSRSSALPLPLSANTVEAPTRTSPSRTLRSARPKTSTTRRPSWTTSSTAAVASEGPAPRNLDNPWDLIQNNQRQGDNQDLDDTDEYQWDDVGA